MSWRGVVGDIRPTYQPESLMEMIRLLPEGIGVIPVHIGIRSGTEAEFGQALKAGEEKVDELATMGVDLIHIGGVPPWMLLGYGPDHKLAERLSQKHGIPVAVASVGLVNALRALSAKKIVGITYFNDALNKKFAKYFTDAGFQVVAMESFKAEFSLAGKIPATEIYSFAKKAYLKAGGADVLYILGSGWSVLPIVETLERDLQTTVVAGAQVTIWDILHHLKVREPIKGAGRLLSGEV